MEYNVAVREYKQERREYGNRIKLMAKPLTSEQIPPELKDKVNHVKRRILFLSPSVVSGQEREARKDDFEMLTSPNLGTGGFGEVFKMRHKSSRNVYAVKVINKAKIIDSGMTEQIRLEVRIMYSLNHEHIIKLYNHFEDDECFYLVLEFAPKGHLYERLKRLGRLSERVAAQYLREVVSAVAYLHSLNPPIIHRDIKPENLLLDANEALKLCDFGWSNFFNPDRKRLTYCGTPDYLSPEMIRQEGHDQRIDLWNIGVLLFEMLTGQPPFQGSNQKQLFESILKLNINYPKDFSKLARDLVQKLLKSNPTERIPLAQIPEHAWLRSQSTIRPVAKLPTGTGPTLPTLLQEIPAPDFQAVSSASQAMALISLPTPELKAAERVPDRPQIVAELRQQLLTMDQELKDLKIRYAMQTRELETALKDRGELSRLLPTNQTQNVQDLNKAIQDERQKLKQLSESRGQVLLELENTSAALRDLVGRHQTLRSELELLTEAKRVLESKVEGQQKQLVEAEAKAELLKQQLGAATFAHEKRQAELQGEIDQLRYQLMSNKTSDSPIVECDITAAIEECKTGVEELRQILEKSVKDRQNEEAANQEIAMLRQKLAEAEIKYEANLYEYQVSIAKSIEDVRLGCEAEKRRALEAKDQIIEELTQQLSQIDLQEGTAAIESYNVKSLRTTNAHLEQALSDLKRQQSLSSRELQQLHEALNRTTIRAKELEYQLLLERQKSLPTTPSADPSGSSLPAQPYASLLYV